MITNEAEYDAALARAWALMDAEPDSDEAEELSRLADAIAAYEAIYYSMGVA